MNYKEKLDKMLESSNYKIEVDFYNYKIRTNNISDLRNKLENLIPNGHTFSSHYAKVRTYSDNGNTHWTIKLNPKLRKGDGNTLYTTNKIKEEDINKLIKYVKEDLNI